MDSIGCSIQGRILQMYWKGFLHLGLGVGTAVISVCALAAQTPTISTVQPTQKAGISSPVNPGDKVTVLSQTVVSQEIIPTNDKKPAANAAVLDAPVVQE